MYNLPFSIGFKLNVAGLDVGTGSAWCFKHNVITEHTLASSLSNSGSSGHCEQNLCKVCTCFFVHRARRPASEMYMRLSIEL